MIQLFPLTLLLLSFSAFSMESVTGYGEGDGGCPAGYGEEAGISTAMSLARKDAEEKCDSAVKQKGDFFVKMKGCNFLYNWGTWSARSSFTCVSQNQEKTSLNCHTPIRCAYWENGYYHNSECPPCW